MGSRIFKHALVFLLLATGFCLAATYEPSVTYRRHETSGASSIFYASVDHQFLVTTTLRKSGSSSNIASGAKICAGQAYNVRVQSIFNNWGWNTANIVVNCPDTPCTGKVYSDGSSSPFIQWITSSDYSCLITWSPSGSSTPPEDDCVHPEDYFKPASYRWEQPVGTPHTVTGRSRGGVWCYAGLRAQVDGSYIGSEQSLTDGSSYLFSWTPTAGSHTTRGVLHIGNCGYYAHGYTTTGDNFRRLYYDKTGSDASDVTNKNVYDESDSYTALSSGDRAALTGSSGWSSPTAFNSGQSQDFTYGMTLSNAAGELNARATSITVRSSPGGFTFQCRSGSSCTPFVDVAAGASTTRTFNELRAIAPTVTSTTTYQVWADVVWSATESHPCGTNAGSGSFSVRLSDITVSPLPINSCVLAPSSANVPASGSQTFTASCYDSGGNLRTCPTLSWSSSIGSLSGTSNVQRTFNAPSTTGSGTVTATRGSGTPAFSCSSSVNVIVPNCASCTINPSSATVNPGASRTFTVTCRNSGGTDLGWCPAFTFSRNPTNFGALSRYSSSSGEAHPAFDFTASTTNFGSGTVRAYYNSSCQCTSSVTVPTPVFSSCTLGVSSSSMLPGSSQSVYATCYNQWGTTIGCPQLTWTANPALVSFSTNPTSATSFYMVYNTITAGSTLGSSTLRATSGSVSCTNTVSVQNASCTISGPTELTVGMPYAYSATCYNSAGSVVSCNLMQWSDSLGGSFSPNPSGAGNPSSTTFTTRTTPGSGNVTATFSGSSISCRRAYNLSAGSAKTCVSLVPRGAELFVGQTQLFTAGCVDQYGNPTACATLTWNSGGAGTMSPGTSTQNSTLTANSVGLNFPINAYRTAAPVLTCPTARVNVSSSTPVELAITLLVTPSLIQLDDCSASLTASGTVMYLDESVSPAVWKNASNAVVLLTMSDPDGVGISIVTVTTDVNGRFSYTWAGDYMCDHLTQTGEHHVSADASFYYGGLYSYANTEQTYLVYSGDSGPWCSVEVTTYNESALNMTVHWGDLELYSVSGPNRISVGPNSGEAPGAVQIGSPAATCDLEDAGKAGTCTSYIWEFGAVPDYENIVFNITAYVPNTPSVEVSCPGVGSFCATFV